MLGWTRHDQRARVAGISATVLLLHVGFGNPPPLTAQDLQMSAAAGWVDPGHWPRVFGGTGPAFRLTLSRQTTDRVNLHGRFTWERLRTVTIDEPSFIDDLPPFDQPVPNGWRGTSIWEGQVGVGFGFLPNPERWDVEGTVGTGMMTLDPDSRTIFPSPSERRWAATLGLDVARRVAQGWWAFTTLEARRIHGINLTGLSDWEINISRHQGPHRRPVGSQWTGALFVGIRTDPGLPGG